MAKKDFGYTRLSPLSVISRHLNNVTDGFSSFYLGRVELGLTWCMMKWNRNWSKKLKSYRG